MIKPEFVRFNTFEQKQVCILYNCFQRLYRLYHPCPGHARFILVAECRIQTVGTLAFPQPNRWILHVWI